MNCHTSATSYCFAAESALADPHQSVGALGLNGRAGVDRLVEQSQVIVSIFAARTVCLGQQG